MSDYSVIRKIRVEKGLSQDYISAKTGIVRTYLSKIENNHLKNVGQEIINKLAKALDVDPSYLRSKINDEPITFKKAPPVPVDELERFKLERELSYCQAQYETTQEMVKVLNQRAEFFENHIDLLAKQNTSLEEKVDVLQQRIAIQNERINVLQQKNRFTYELYEKALNLAYKFKAELDNSIAESNNKATKMAFEGLKKYLEMDKTLKELLSPDELLQKITE